MKALYWNGAGAVEWRDDPAPVLQAPSDALVRPTAVSTCDLDQAIMNASRPLPGSERPFAIGHEGVGEVVEVGDAVTGFVPGDRVAVPYHVSCGACDRCADGMPLYCRAIAGDGLAVYDIPVGPDYGGVFCDLIRVPFADQSLLRLPPSVSTVDAVSIGDNLTDAWRIVAPFLEARPGADVLVMSSGSAGLYAVDVAVACGARRVRYVDDDAGRLATAAALGAEADELAAFSPDGLEYELTLNAAGSREALRHAILATAPGGRCESMAFHFRDVELPLLTMHLRCVHFRSSLSNARTHMPDALRLLASGRLRPELIRTEVLPFDDAADAMPTAGFKPVFVRES